MKSTFVQKKLLKHFTRELFVQKCFASKMLMKLTQVTPLCAAKKSYKIESGFLFVTAGRIPDELPPLSRYRLRLLARQLLGLHLHVPAIVPKKLGSFYN